MSIPLRLLRLYPYDMVSGGCKELSNALDVYRVSGNSRTFRPRRNTVVLNWGNSQPPSTWRSDRWINPPAGVAIAADKLLTFNKLKEHDVPHVPFTTSLEEATLWSSESDVVARSLLRGSGGRGISISKKGEPPHTSNPEGAVRLWTKYVKKIAEYRVHVFNQKVLYTQEKRKRRGAEHNTAIRNLDGGYVFCREDVEPNDTRDDIAIRAVRALGIHFGAVDIIFNKRNALWLVLEVNTSPGLEGQSITDYANAIRAYMEQLN